jgi:hypothetical protein
MRIHIRCGGLGIAFAMDKLAEQQAGNKSHKPTVYSWD